MWVGNVFEVLGLINWKERFMIYWGEEVGGIGFKVGVGEEG